MLNDFECQQVGRFDKWMQIYNDDDVEIKTIIYGNNMTYVGEVHIESD
jgi:hypothetical protein